MPERTVFVSYSHKDKDLLGPLVAQLKALEQAGLLDVWVESWQAAYPSINFHARRHWAEARFVELQREGARILVAEISGALVGLVAVEPATGYIDQIVVATAAQRRGVASQLIAAARGVSPTVLELHVNQDNAPAVAAARSMRSLSRMRRRTDDSVRHPLQRHPR